MSALDVVAIPGYPGEWARRAVVEAWIEAGCPPLNWAGRTYEEQLDLALYGPNAADDPRVSWTRVPHVRGLALDLASWTPAIVKRMQAAGFVRPITVRKGKPWADGKGGFSQDEPWHFELKQYVNRVFDIPKVKASQTAGLDSRPFDPEEDDDMFDEKDRAHLNALYAGFYGARNLTGKDGPVSWENHGGRSQQALYGLLPIDIETQKMVASLQGQVSALLELVQQLAKPGAPIDMAVIAAAAETGAREAIDGLTLTAHIE